MRHGSGLSDEDYQERVLPHVSRTFALTIPQLPAGLRTAVTNAYLLCRIADTIEDEPAVSPEETHRLLRRFAAVVSGLEPAAELAADLAPRLTERTLPAERDLIINMPVVVRVLEGCPEPQRRAIRHCIEVMGSGMHRFQRTASVAGLERSTDLDFYCYYVAGIVGETLTELFCSYSPALAERRAALRELAASFGQGLQMTNILKDVWEDRSRGACWLPREVFARHGVDLACLDAQHLPAGFEAGLRELIGVAHGHLRNALSFTLLIPQEEAGIRRFCLWAIGLAVLTLQRIARRPQFTAGGQVKVSRRAVTLTRVLTNLALRHDRALSLLFSAAAHGLPLAPAALVRTHARAASLGPHATFQSNDKSSAERTTGGGRLTPPPVERLSDGSSRP